MKLDIRDAKKIGGRNKIVEIDEAKFGRRKHHNGRIVDRQWVVLGIERDRSKCVFLAVKDRS